MANVEKNIHRKYAGLIIVLIMISSFFLSCSFGGGGDDSPSLPSIGGKIPRHSFNSLKYTLDVTADMPNGVELTVTINNKTATAIVYDKSATFNISEAFHKGILGGKSYTASITANNYSGAVNLSLEYYPKTELTILSDEEVNIFNGDTKAFVLPVLQTNYIEEKIITKYRYEVYRLKAGNEKANPSKDDNLTDIEGADSWSFSKAKEYLSKESNAGTYVLLYCRGIPRKNSEESEELASNEYYIVYYCKKDTLVKNVKAEYFYDYLKAVLTDDSGNEAGGNIAYQWQISSDGSTFTDIENATTDKYKVQKSDIEKKLRISIVQTYAGETKSAITSSAVDAKHSFIKDYIYYGEIALQNAVLETTKFYGDLINTFDESIAISDCTINLTPQSLTSSSDVLVTVSKSGYNDYKSKLFVYVCYPKPSDAELNLLSTDINSITAGKARFASENSSLEWSKNGSNWNNIETTEFEAAVNDTIYVRRKASGTINTYGYIKESEAAQIKITSENIGVKAAGEIAVGIKNIKFKLSKTKDNKNVTFTATIEKFNEVYNGNFYVDYTWKIDGVNAGEYPVSGVTVNGALLTVDTTNFVKDTYSVNVTVKIMSEDKTDLFNALSAQDVLIVE